MFFEVFLGIVSNETEVGRLSVRLRAESRFSAALKAEKHADSIYTGSYSRVRKVNRISRREFYHLPAA